MGKLDYIFQKEIELALRPRGFHLITDEILRQLPELKEVKTGFLHVFIKHTSAGLSINENADPTVREDFKSHFDEMVPEDQPYYKHTLEGSDDMPAHIKSSLMGFSVQVPVTMGRLNLGTWQGIYLGEHRDHGGSRKLVLTIYGEKKS
ncbi:secondary thiamine-phosphate synthase enzyme YjbQ [Salinimicrobium xinjiangense]|uniref:secondary thiamine-phosphate synthase enzyme YjbQ n=1 Tax=Salinimicrobium xinjiangense TaxID=438596 RepID=UPI00048F6347|nr:secondary thiamine-phosphate synthase enzyme YjbQ [Salinimicrobium xinjiangense]